MHKIKSVSLPKILLSFLLVSLSLLALIFTTRNQKQYCNDCNVIIISIEMLRSDHLPCYGYDKDTAPHICEFAENAILFNNHYTQEPFTLSAHASLFTSLYPTQHKLRFILKDEMPHDITTIAEVLNNNGYYNLWSATIDDPHLPADKGLERGFDYYSRSIRKQPAKSWLDTLEQAKDKDKFFAFLHTFNIHEPFAVNEKESAYQFTDEVVEGFPVTTQESNTAIVNVLTENFDQLIPLIDEETKRQHSELFTNPYQHNEEIIYKVLYPSKNQRVLSKVRELVRSTWEKSTTSDPRMEKLLTAIYDGQIYETDKAFKEVVDFLENEGLSKNTIVIVWSALGESLNDHDNRFAYYHDLHQSSIKTPLIIYTPGNTPNIIEKPVRTIDIMPTVFNLLNIDIPDQAEGKSMAGFLFGNDEMKHTRTVYSEQGGGTAETLILDNKWKLILNYDSGLNRPPKQLYNLEEDPEEKNDLIDIFPSIEARLFEIMGNEKVNWKQYQAPKSQFPDWVDEKTRKRLIEKGYF